MLKIQIISNFFVATAFSPLSFSFCTPKKNIKTITKFHNFLDEIRVAKKSFLAALISKKVIHNAALSLCDSKSSLSGNFHRKFRSLRTNFCRRHFAANYQTI